MRILLILDGSIQTVQAALLLSSERNAMLSALFVKDSTWNEFTGSDWLSDGSTYTDFLKYIDAQESAIARCTVEEFVRQAVDMAVNHRVKIVRGRISEEVLSELTNGYDILVMSHPLNRGLESMRDAGIKIIKNASCSIYLVKCGDLKKC